jgi:mannose-6-phosphate isomerase-like protein (cupin superfamily)
MKRTFLLALVAVVALGGVAAADTPAKSAVQPAKSAEQPRYLTKTEDVKPAKLGSKGEEYPLVDSTSIGSNKAALTMVRAKGKATVKKHGHTSTEILVVLSGKATIGGASRADTVTVGEAAGAWIPANREHSLTVEGSSGSPAAVLVFHAPGATLTDKPAAPLVREWSAVTELSIAKGKGTVKILFDKDSGGDGSAYAGYLKLSKGAAVDEHVHADEVEVLWIVAGTGDMLIDGQQVRVSAGMSVAIPAGTKHAFVATSDVEAVQFYAPGGPEERFKVAANRQKAIEKARNSGVLGVERPKPADTTTKPAETTK